jgi:hypothetical protein
MIRINSIHKLALTLFAALALGGCAAPGTEQEEDGQSEGELRGAHLVRIDDGRGGEASTIGGLRTAPAATHPASAQGPQPDPWTDEDGPPGGPQPDPWNPSRGDPNGQGGPGGPDDQ